MATHIMSKTIVRTQVLSSGKTVYFVKSPLYVDEIGLIFDKSGCLIDTVVCCPSKDTCVGVYYAELEDLCSLIPRD